MDTKMLEAFVKLYEKRSLRQAAEQLYVSPQGLSRLLQNLEGELDVMLFTRTPRGMEPTAAGEHLYRQADVLLRQHRQLAQDIQRIGGRGTDLSFVCSYGVLNALPYVLLQEFQAENPSFTIKWREFPDRQAEQLLLDDRYELGLFVLGRDGFGDGYAVTELFSRRIVLLAYEGHPLYDARSVRFDQLRNEPIIMEGSDFWVFDFFRERCISHGFCPNIVAETGDISFCHKLCSMGQGLGISVDFIADFIQIPNLRMIPFEDPSFLWPVGPSTGGLRTAAASCACCWRRTPSSRGRTTTSVWTSPGKPAPFAAGSTGNFWRLPSAARSACA